MRALPSIVLTTTCGAHDNFAVRRDLVCPKTGEVICYYYRPTNHPYNPEIELAYNRFPVIFRTNQNLWPEANLYILDLLSFTVNADTKNEISIAKDLAAYAKFLDEQNLRFDSFPRERFLRPTYRFASYLRNKVAAGELALSTAKRRISTIVRFYIWLEDDLGRRWENTPFQKKSMRIQIPSREGGETGIPVLTTDLKIVGSVATPPIEETINDGGRLRPLPMEEQKILLGALLDTSNTEMKLIFLLALFTGGRIQSVCLLHAHSFVAVPDDSRSVLVVPVGLGTKVDTKKNKKLVLQIPRWLHEKLCIYAASERRLIRCERAKNTLDKDLLFLTNRGTPYYETKVSRQTFDKSSRKAYATEGHAVRTFITNTLLPKIRIAIPSFRFSFHDLRATCGMNLADALLREVELNNMTLHEVRKTIANVLGHDDPSTTDRYINYRSKIALGKSIQKNYELHLQEITEAAQQVSI